MSRRLRSHLHLARVTTLKLAFRALLKSPFVTSVAIVSLALGIGANAAIFSLFDQRSCTGRCQFPARLSWSISPHPGPNRAAPAQQRRRLRRDLQLPEPAAGVARPAPGDGARLAIGASRWQLAPAQLLTESRAGGAGFVGLLVAR